MAKRTNTHEPYLTGNERIEKVKEMLDEHFKKINLILDDYMAGSTEMCDEIEVVNQLLAEEVEALERDEDFDSVFDALKQTKRTTTSSFDLLANFILANEGESSLVYELSDKNYICVKVENMDSKAKLEDFIKSEIYPLYSDQQTYLN